jgi:hypothetical protein
MVVHVEEIRTPQVPVTFWLAPVDGDRIDHRLDGRAGGVLLTFYNFGPLGFLGELAPFLTLKGTNRVPDSGSEANPANTGYDRILIAPGIETSIGSVRLYADIAFPIYQNVTGNQIIAPVLVSAIVSYSF